MIKQKQEPESDDPIIFKDPIERASDLQEQLQELLGSSKGESLEKALDTHLENVFHQEKQEPQND